MAIIDTRVYVDEQGHEHFADVLGTQHKPVSGAGAGFLTEAEFEAAWADVPEFSGTSNYQADRLDAQGDIVGEKTVDVVTCEKLTGKPITTLILEGRAKLAAELPEYRKAA